MFTWLHGLFRKAAASQRTNAEMRLRLALRETNLRYLLLSASSDRSAPR
ncbi:hypothetical protein JSE7799_00475 [Jannaschia seosinensis]|uniref:Uncharacterized protein n=1 Tax=Jannaschia seosinensis TaxID=313367 RepID=A0A0M7B4N3_9RHOB|nr:hypothetical protein [Jannaschia seosinensis]CUH19385.1 hypothetical protein JSE7799_00475 [Jannaschia seosinensis]